MRNEITSFDWCLVSAILIQMTSKTNKGHSRKRQRVMHRHPRRRNSCSVGAELSPRRASVFWKWHKFSRFLAFYRDRPSDEGKRTKTSWTGNKDSVNRDDRTSLMVGVASGAERQCGNLLVRFHVMVALLFVWRIFPYFFSIATICS